MSQNKQNLEKAILRIGECMTEVDQLLSHAPMLQVQAKHVLERLTNSLKVANGSSLGEESATGDELTHILGVPIRGQKDIKPPVVVEDDVKDIEYLAQQVVEDIQSGAESKDVLEKHGAKAVLAASIITGSSPDGAEIEDVNVDTVDGIRAVLEADAERMKQVQESEAAAKESENNQENKAPEADDNTPPAANTPEQKKESLKSKIETALTNINEAETERELLPTDATPQEKGACTKRINELKKEFEKLEAELAELETPNE